MSRDVKCAIAFAIVLAPSSMVRAAQQVECAGFSSGGTVSGDSMIVVGQPIAGSAVSAQHGVQAGFLGCVGIDLPAIPGDLDGDSNVDGFDLALLLGQWTGATSYVPCPPHADADLNADCKINGFDLAMLLGAWG